MNLNHVLAMGGYGLFVWPAYCITLFVFGLNIIYRMARKSTY